MPELFKILFICCVLISSSFGARILAISHWRSHSHFTIVNRILTELAVKGHQVTFITPFEQTTPVKNLQHVVITGLDHFYKSHQENLFVTAENNFMERLYAYHNFGLYITEAVLNSTNVQKLLQSHKKFDVVIHEKFMNDAFSGLSYHFKAPSVIINPTAASYRINDQMGSANNPSYIRDTILGMPHRMGFLERAHNSFVYACSQAWNEFVTLPGQNAILQKYFPGAPHLKELYYNTSLVLLNSHPIINPAIPLSPNIISIGGYHMQPTKPLPTHLQRYLDEGTEGVILFSMGSNLKVKDIPEHLRNGILDAFAGIKQKVIWKSETDQLPNLPKNVQLLKWLPQQDVLGHPNVKLFITHGGLLSHIEAVYHGVPIFTIPVFGDQPFNMKNAEHGGYGLGIRIRELTSENFRKTLNELLNNSRYARNAKKASIIMRDQEIKPLDKAVYWIEYVIRHKDTSHLRTAAVDLYWYQNLLLDVFVCILVAAIGTVWSIYKALQLLCSFKHTLVVSVAKKNK